MIQQPLPRRTPLSGSGSFQPVPPDVSPGEGDIPPLQWRGFAAAPGRVSGPALVLRRGGSAASTTSGNIIVCPVLSRSILAEHPGALAFVAEGGGALSLAAAQAREAGVPAVVGLDMATAAVHDGDLIEVDGGEGVIRILARALPRTG
jgi:phosphohistidine swiveling domain-containing protein